MPKEFSPSQIVEDEDAGLIEVLKGNGTHELEVVHSLEQDAERDTRRARGLDALRAKSFLAPKSGKDQLVV